MNTYTRLLLLSAIFFMDAIYGKEYEISLLERENCVGIYMGLKSINDKGQVLGDYLELSNGHVIKNKIYLHDSKTGFKIIESNNGSILSPLKLNNAGQIVGHCGVKSFFWSKNLGIRWLEGIDSTYVVATDLNDLGQVVGNYISKDTGKYHPFLWDYGVVTDMGVGSEFARQFEALGFNIIDIRLTGNNNKGELVGYFVNGKFNVKQQKYVATDWMGFFWDGELHIFTLPYSLSKYYDLSLSNSGDVLIKSESQKDTFVWNLQDGLWVIDGFQGNRINDSGVILGNQVITRGNEVIFVPAIWNNNDTTPLAILLDVANVNAMAQAYSDSYDLEKLGPFIDINNKGQIGCMGTIWNDSYPCVLSPLKPFESDFDLGLFLQDYNQSTDVYKGSPLAYAIRTKNQKALKILVDFAPKDDPALIANCFFLAAERGNVEAISLMVNAGWDVNVRHGANQESLLHCAAKFGQLEVCQELIDLGLDCNVLTNDGQSPLHFAADCVRSSPNLVIQKQAHVLAKTLIANGANVNFQDSRGVTPLISLCRGTEQAIPLIKTFLEQGANPNLRDKSIFAPLHCVLHKRLKPADRLAVSKLLLDYGADPNAFSRNVYDQLELLPYKYEITPIVVAIALDEFELVNLLVNAGAYIHSPVRSCEYGTMYPIDYAKKWNRSKIIDFLSKI